MFAQSSGTAICSNSVCGAVQVTHGVAHLGEVLPLGMLSMALGAAGGTRSPRARHHHKVIGGAKGAKRKKKKKKK